MNAFSRARQYFLKPDKNTSLGIMFVGFGVYAIGVLLGYRFVALGGLLISAVAIINYVRCFFSENGIPPKARQPWDE